MLKMRHWRANSYLLSKGNLSASCLRCCKVSPSFGFVYAILEVCVLLWCWQVCVVWRKGRWVGWGNGAGGFFSFWCGSVVVPVIQRSFNTCSLQITPWSPLGYNVLFKLDNTKSLNALSADWCKHSQVTSSADVVVIHFYRCTQTDTHVSVTQAHRQSVYPHDWSP